MLLAHDPTDDDPDSPGHEGTRAEVPASDRMPVGTSWATADDFRCRPHGMTVAVEIDADGDGENDATAFVPWKLDGPDAVPDVRHIRFVPLPGMRSGAVEAAIRRSREWLECSRLVREAA